MSHSGAQTVTRRLCCVCGQDEAETWFRPRRSPGPIVRCRRCGFVYVNPIEDSRSLIEAVSLAGRSPHLLTSTDLEDIRGSWEEPFIEAYMREFAAKQVNAREALAHLHALTPVRGNLLDIGCGCGVFLSVAAGYGWNCFGLEPSVMPAIYARGRFGLRVLTDVLRPDAYPPDFFDAVTAFQMFEHLLDPGQETARISQVLKPGGLLAVEVPNIETWLVRFLKGQHRHFVEDHVSFFSARTLDQFLRRYGYQVRHVSYPTRTLSLQHLAQWWIGHYAGRPLGEGLARLLGRLKLEGRTVRVNLGDIVMVIGQKASA